LPGTRVIKTRLSAYN